MDGSLLGAKQTYPAVKHQFECKDDHGTADPAIRKLAFCVKWQKDWDQCSLLGCKDNKVLVDLIQGQFPMDPNAEGLLMLKTSGDTTSAHASDDGQVSKLNDHITDTVLLLIPL
ncbi:hypothetical protein A2U01_0009192, partial [Trifolium medium]|nr:hypothetical protein [Trifolium medium]